MPGTVPASEPSGLARNDHLFGTGTPRGRNCLCDAGGGLSCAGAFPRLPWSLRGRSIEGPRPVSRHVFVRVFGQSLWDMTDHRHELNRGVLGYERRNEATSAESLSAQLASQGVRGNSRLTGQMAAVLLVLLAAEGATLLSVRQLITPHVFIGTLLVPPVAVKIGSTGWRMVRYYRGSSAYRAKGPPPLVLRLLGPVVVILTGVVIGSGIVVLLVPYPLSNQMLFIHKASFVLWFGTMIIHVLGHLADTARLAPADLVRNTRVQVRGAGARLWTVAVSLVTGAVLGVVMLPTVGTWLAGGGRGG